MSNAFAIGVYKKKKRIGFLYGNVGGDWQILTFASRQEAQTAANIESTQMEAVGKTYKPVNVKQEAHRFRKRQGLT